MDAACDEMGARPTPAEADRRVLAPAMRPPPTPTPRPSNSRIRAAAPSCSRRSEAIEEAAEDPPREADAARAGPPLVPAPGGLYDEGGGAPLRAARGWLPYPPPPLLATAALYADDEGVRALCGRSAPPRVLLPLRAVDAAAEGAAAPAIRVRFISALRLANSVAVGVAPPFVAAIAPPRDTVADVGRTFAGRAAKAADADREVLICLPMKKRRMNCPLRAKCGMKKNGSDVCEWALRCVLRPPNL